MSPEVIPMRRTDTEAETFNVGHGLSCDLSTLIDTRLLIQANSGGGKSWCLRRLLEQTHGRVQHLVIDPEGEFASLRERYDYILAAPSDGDTAAHPRTAKLLAERLLELGVSAILDIYELNPDDRKLFVSRFLDALVNAPRALWHPALIVLDEAHIFAPEKEESPSATAVKAMASRGRKRGFCLVAATQRIAKLSKDVAAECNNKLIGRCVQDVDMARAAGELGFAKSDQQKFRALDAGEFFAFGPALSRNVSFVRVGTVETSHPKAGARLGFAPPPPTAKVRALLPKLADLPAEAEARERNVADLQKEIGGLKRELTEARKAQTETRVERVEVPTITRDMLQRVTETVENVRTEGDAIGEYLQRVVTDAHHKLTTAIDPILVSLNQLVSAQRQSAAPAAKAPVSGIRPAARISRPAPQTVQSGDLSKVERTFLTVLAQRDGKSTTRNQLAVFAGYSSKSRHVDNTISGLRVKGFVGGSSTALTMTEPGAAALGRFVALPSGADLREYWIANAGGAAEAAMLRVLFEAYPRALSRDELAEASNYSVTSRHVDNTISHLRTLDLVVGSKAELRASADLFE